MICERCGSTHDVAEATEWGRKPLTVRLCRKCYVSWSVTKGILLQNYHMRRQRQARKQGPPWVGFYYQSREGR